MGQKCCFLQQEEIKKRISELLSTKAKLGIAHSSLLCSLSLCESNCVRTCVCVYADSQKRLPSHFTLHSLTSHLLEDV